MTRTALEGFGKCLRPSDEVVVEATGNAMAVVRVLSPFVARVVIANPLQVKAIAHAHVKTDKIDAGVLASLRAAGAQASFAATRRPTSIEVLVPPSTYRSCKLKSNPSQLL
jgi:hypothetical protein